MKHKFLLVAIAGVLIAAMLTACAPVAQSSEPEKEAQSTEAYRKISAEEAKQKIDENKDVIIVDVRTPEEYAEKHLEGAINIPNETIADRQPEQLPDQDAEILVYCRTGVRSKQASDKLVEMGYQNIYDMGGIADWPYETVTGK